MPARPVPRRSDAISPHGISQRKLYLGPRRRLDLGAITSEKLMAIEMRAVSGASPRAHASAAATV